MLNMTTNPFVTNGYAGPEYFCDRSSETKTLVELITNGNNVALISPRRLGKTDLIHHCFNQDSIKKHFHTFIIDIYATGSLNEFVHLFGKAILDELKPKGKKALEKFLNTLKSIHSEITFDINGIPSWGIGLGNLSSPEITLDEIFEYLRTADKHCMVTIDEFQQITQYPEKNVEATLRTHIQRCPNATFIFSGSQRHLMGEMFISPSRPFYQSVTIMNLHPIPKDNYWKFAEPQFAKGGGRKLEHDVFETIYDKFHGVTANIQKILNILYIKTEKGKACTSETIEPAIDSYIELSSDTYETMLKQMPDKQRNTFIAIALEGRAKNISGSKFVNKYNLTSASSVMSAVKGLLEKDFITYEENEYYVYDQFFQIWIEKRYH